MSRVLPPGGAVASSHGLAVCPEELVSDEEIPDLAVRFVGTLLP